MNKITFLSLALLSLTLAACAGGRSVLPTTAAQSDAVFRVTPNGATAIGHGTLLSVPEGKPLAGFAVALAPWKAVNGKYLAPQLVTTTAADGTFTIHAAPGQYLLQIGPNIAYTAPPGYQTPAPTATSDPGIPGVTWYATIHDHITVVAGEQTLKAPTLPLEQRWHPHRIFYPPAVERSGNYRILRLRPIEAECLAIEQLDRQHLKKGLLVPDEWLFENTRALNVAQVKTDFLNYDGLAWIGYPIGSAVSGDAGGNTCNDMVDGYNNYDERNGATIWFGADYTPPKTIAGVGAEEWFIDPRTQAVPWP